MEDIEALKKQLEHYKKKLSLAEYDVAMDGYVAYVNIVRQQVEYIKDFDIKSNIEGKKSENAMYDRTEAMWKNLPDMISSMNKLKLELNIPFDENEGKPKMGATTPQSLVNKS
ncbi:MAG: hypothetical protein V4547_16910 [Bacteroidota bacterium]